MPPNASAAEARGPVAPGPAASSRGRRILFRAATLLVVALPWFAGEVGLRVAGWPPEDELADPHVAFEARVPLFSLTDDGRRRQTDPARLAYFRPDSFEVPKPPGEFRVFVVGGSTVQGRPYAIETAFPTWLEMALGAACPDRRWRVVNCGGVSYASYRLVPVVEEILDYEPDLVILCTGHNEFLEWRTYEALLAAPPWRRVATRTVGRLALVRAVHRWIAEAPVSATETLPTEVDARLDYEDALAGYRRDDAWAEAVRAHFESSLERIAVRCGRQGVPVLAVQPPWDLRDTPPFLSADSVPQAETRERVERLLRDPAWIDTRLDRRLADLLDASRADPRVALTHYWLGRAYDEAGDASSAARHLQRAVDEDLCPLRVTGPLRRTLREVADRRGWEWFDAQQFLADRCRGRIVDRTVLVDHVHPTIESHRELGWALMFPVAGLAGVRPESDLHRFDADGDRHLESLPIAYFEHGRQRLEALEAWARGRAIHAKTAPSAPGRRP